MRYSQTYLDNISSAPIHKDICDEMTRHYIEHYGLPGAPHQWGQWSKAAIESYSERSLNFLGCDATCARFCIGAELPSIGGTVLISDIEAEVIKKAAVKYREVEHIPMQGCKYDIDAVSKILMQHNIGLVIAAAADRITGTIQPISELSKICAQHNVPIFCDISPLIGRHRFRLDEMGIKNGFIEGRVFGAPCDLLIGEKTDFIFPLPLAAGFVRTLEWIFDEFGTKMDSICELIDYFWELLQMHLPDLLILGESPRLAGMLTVAFEDVDRAAIMLALDMQGVAIWAGNSFSEPIEQMRVMGIPDKLSESAVRFSAWHGNTKEQIDYVLRVLPPLVDRIRFEKKARQPKN